MRVHWPILEKAFEINLEIYPHISSTVTLAPLKITKYILFFSPIFVGTYQGGQIYKNMCMHMRVCTVHACAHILSVDDPLEKTPVGDCNI